MNAARLDITQSYQLMVLVKDEFVSSNLNDGEFAEYATDKLKFPVNNDHVKTRRNALGIEPKLPKKILDRNAVFELIQELEERVARLERICK
jgi:hypothetical protein